MSSSASYPFCIATMVTQKAIAALLEGAFSEDSGSRSYRDTHPWLIARDMLAKAESENLVLPILFACASDDAPAEFSHWSSIRAIDVVELHRGQWDSRCDFLTLRAFNPIWSPIDSVFVKASAEQMAREELENIRVFRQALDEHHIHPYAICETPAFITQVLSEQE